MNAPRDAGRSAFLAALALAQAVGEGALVMRQIKQALDPHGILNPGKVFDR